MARDNIQFLGYLPDDEVRRQMAGCRAFIFPGEEDFGLTPLEAMAAGRPVIAYGAGGALDYVQEGVTGLLFDSPDPEALAEAVRRLDACRFDPEMLRAQAGRFSVARFRQEMGAFLEAASSPGSSDLSR